MSNMDNSIYLPTPELRAVFEGFRKLKTAEEKEAYKKKIRAEFDKKTPEEKEVYYEASKKGILAIRDRVEELIEIVKRENEAKIMAMV